MLFSASKIHKVIAGNFNVYLKIRKVALYFTTNAPFTAVDIHSNCSQKPIKFLKIVL